MSSVSGPGNETSLASPGRSTTDLGEFLYMTPFAAINEGVGPWVSGGDGYRTLALEILIDLTGNENHDEFFAKFVAFAAIYGLTIHQFYDHVTTTLGYHVEVVKYFTRTK